MLTSATCRAAAALIPYAHVPDDEARLLERDDNPLFLVGLELRENVDLPDPVHQRPIAHRRISYRS
jgi:hypothetical protein